MAFNREQLALRARGTARQLLNTLVHEGIVEHFVGSYVAEFDRPGLKASALRYRELLATLRRECLLAMAAKMGLELPRRLARGRRRVSRGADVEVQQTFQEEFLGYLAESFEWAEPDLEEFRRDLALYAQLAARQPRRAASRKRGGASGPFVDRCALLLDPALLDRARGAAGKFLVELERVTDRALEKVFRPERKA